MHLWRPPRITHTISDGYSAAPCMMAKAVALGIKGPHTSYAHRFCCLQTPTMLPLPPLCYLKALKCYLAPKGNTRKHCIKNTVSFHPTTLILIRNQRCYFLPIKPCVHGVFRFMPFIYQPSNLIYIVFFPVFRGDKYTAGVLPCIYHPAVYLSPICRVLIKNG